MIKSFMASDRLPHVVFLAADNGRGWSFENPFAGSKPHAWCKERFGPYGGAWDWGYGENYYLVEVVFRDASAAVEFKLRFT